MRFYVRFSVSAPLKCGFMYGFMCGLRFQTKKLFLTRDLFTWVAEREAHFIPHLRGSKGQTAPFAAYGCFKFDRCFLVELEYSRQTGSFIRCTIFLKDEAMKFFEMLKNFEISKFSTRPPLYLRGGFIFCGYKKKVSAIEGEENGMHIILFIREKLRSWEAKKMVCCKFENVHFWST